MTDLSANLRFPLNAALGGALAGAFLLGAATPGAQAAKPDYLIPASPPPVFVTVYLARNLKGAEIARARYSHEDARAFLRRRKRAPIQVSADFNGDGKRDWAGLIQGKDGRIRLIAVYSTPGGYRHRVLQKNVGQRGYPLRVSVALQKPARIRETPAKDKPKTVRLRRPAISFVYFEKSSVIFYWTGGRFAELWTSD